MDRRNDGKRTSEGGHPPQRLEKHRTSQRGRQEARQENALRHGFSSKFRCAEFSEAVESLVHRIRGEMVLDNELLLELARTAATAVIELEHVRAAKLSLIERATLFGALRRPRHFKTDNDQVKWLIQMDNWTGRGRRPNRPKPDDFLSDIPVEGPERGFEAMRRSLPELAKLERYEKRVAGRRAGNSLTDENRQDRRGPAKIAFS